jgi:hypothetical protein
MFTALESHFAIYIGPPERELMMEVRHHPQIPLLAPRAALRLKL